MRRVAVSKRDVATSSESALPKDNASPPPGSAPPETRTHAVMDALSAQNPLRGQEDLPDVPRVSTRGIDFATDRPTQLKAVQALLVQLEYNHLPTTFFDLKKDRPLNRIIATAKEILAESLPIRCLEATFLAIHLTQHLHDVERVPLAFKSRCAGQHYRHIVLLVRHGGHFGALGLSRKADLMDKPLRFASLMEIVAEYDESYRRNGHRLVSIRLGLCVDHDSTSRSVPCFKFMTVSISKACETVKDDTRLEQLLTRFEQMLGPLSLQYRSAPTASTLRGGYLTTPSTTPPVSPAAPPAALDGGANDESDGEENQHRLHCLLQGRSPFLPSPFATAQTAPRKPTAATKPRARVSTVSTPQSRTDPEPRPE